MKSRKLFDDPDSFSVTLAEQHINLSRSMPPDTGEASLGNKKKSHHDGVTGNTIGSSLDREAGSSSYPRTT